MFEIALLAEEDAQVVQRLGEVRPNLERALIQVECLLRLAGLKECVSEIVQSGS